MDKKKKLLVIVGPTAVGKTALSIRLAQIFNGDVISGDSLQVYKKLDIGTAKVTLTEQDGISHHLIDVKDATETYSAHEFKKSAASCIDEISNQEKLPIIAGGTGLYIQSLLFDFQLGNAETEEEKAQSLLKRQELEQFAMLNGNEALWELLNRQDEIAAKTIHPNNVKRVIRAIEVYDKTGVSITEQQQVDFKNLDNSSYDVKMIGLTTERELLYKRINQRVDIMVTSGLIEEAKYVYDLGATQASQGIGYKEFFPYFEGEITIEEAIEKVKQHSRQYAKRQLTWFQNRMTVEWWDLVKYPEKIEILEKDIRTWYSE